MLFNTKKWFKLSNLLVIIIIPLLLVVAWINKSQLVKIAATNNNDGTNQESVLVSELPVTEVVLPIANYATNRTKQVFGQYVTEPELGYNTSDDIEVDASQKGDISVMAVADGEIIYKKWTTNYGGLVVIKHFIDQSELKTIYGHLRLASIAKNTGDTIAKGEIIGMLGADYSYDTDNQHRHLHFGIYQGSDINLSVEVSKPEQLVNWLNPTDFFQKYNFPTSALGELTLTPLEQEVDFKLSFKYPAFWQAEYLPQEKLLNLFSLQGNGSGLERSQILIYLLVADNFQVPSRFEVLEQNEANYAGQESVNYQVKIREVDALPMRPNWCNLEHRITVIKNKEQANQYYIFEQNPELPTEQFEQLLNSLIFSKAK
ncbi:MAG: M23 family metallopeptidase [Patescibacteria group bacterium]